MKKAVISTGGKQYLVTEGETLEVELLKTDSSKFKFDALLIVDGEKTSVGTPLVKEASVAVEVLEAQVKADKVTSIRYKSKKRVHKVHGHRQILTKIKIGKIS